MKVILIKDCQDGKANTIVEVSAGYATNFLIKKGYGVAYTEKNIAKLNRELDNLLAEEYSKRSNAFQLKAQLEELELQFSLTSNKDKNGNLNVHGSISAKDIDKKLKELGFNLPKHALQKIHLVSFGWHEITVHLYKEIQAKLKIFLNITHEKK